MAQAIEEVSDEDGRGVVVIASSGEGFRPLIASVADIDGAEDASIAEDVGDAAADGGGGDIGSGGFAVPDHGGIGDIAFASEPDPGQPVAPAVRHHDHAFVHHRAGNGPPIRPVVGIEAAAAPQLLAGFRVVAGQAVGAPGHDDLSVARPDDLRGGVRIIALGGGIEIAVRLPSDRAGLFIQCDQVGAAILHHRHHHRVPSQHRRGPQVPQQPVGAIGLL